MRAYQYDPKGTPHGEEKSTKMTWLAMKKEDDDEWELEQKKRGEL